MLYPPTQQEPFFPPTGYDRIKLTIAFDGSRYQGWQIQKIGVGVQQIVEEALHKLLPEASSLIGCSRTDAGVHALGLVAHFDIPKLANKIPMKRLPLAINSILPPDIRVLKADICKGPFHARFSAKAKEYRYQIWNSHVMNPLLRTYAWHIPKKLNVEDMRAAAERFIGTHDFIAFSTNPGYPRKHTIRTIHLCKIYKKGLLLVVRIIGDGFLYRMCRGIVGTIVQVGLGKFKPEDITTIFEQKKRQIAGMNAPAHGLILWKVFY